MKKIFDKIKNSKIWAAIGSFFARVGHALASAAKSVAGWFIRHWRLAMAVTVVLVVLAGTGIALALTLPLKSVEIEGEVILLQGEEYVSGLTVKATTKAGLVHREEVLPSMLSGLDPNVPGEQEVTVRYKRREAKTVVNVIALSEITLRVREGTMPTEYEPNDPFPQGGVFDVFHGERLIRSAPISRANAPGFTTLLSGNYSVILSYRTGLSVSYDYTVLEIMESITPVGKLYAAQGVVLSKETAIGNIRFLVKYKDGTEAEIPIYDESIGVQTAVLEEREGEYSTEIILIYKGYLINCPTYAYKGSLMSVRSMALNLTKTVYIQGEDFDFSTAYVEVEYLRFVGAPVLLRVTPEMLSQTTFPEAGSLVLSATYAGETAYASVRVITPEEAAAVTAINTTWRGRKEGPPLKGQDLDFDGATITATYGYGYREEIVALTADMVTGYDKTLAGEQELTLTYGEYSRPIVFRVGDPDSTEATRIFAVMGWNEPTYYTSAALIVPDTAYLDVEIGYGARRVSVPLSDPDVTITGFTPHVLDEQILTITYQSLSVQQGFYVQDDREETIIGFWAPDSITIAAGEELDLSGACTVFYSTGRQEYPLLSEVMALGGRMEGSFDANMPGDYRVNFYHPDFESTDHTTRIHVIGDAPVTAIGIRIDVSGGKVAYKVGESLDLSGMTLYLNYSDSTQVDITESLYPGIVSDFYTTTPGTRSATVSYFYDEGNKNFVTTFDYTVE